MHQAIKEGNTEILEESFADAMHSIVKFFENLLKKFRDFMKKVFTIINAYFGDFEKFVSKHKDELKNLNPNFTIRGYTYSFTSGLPNTSKIENIINSYNSEVSEIDKMNKLTIINDRQKFMNESNLDEIRAYVMGSSTGVKQENFTKELRKSFRSKEEEEKDIHVDKGYLNKIIDEYPEMKRLYNETSKQKDQIAILIENIKNFFNKSASVYYTGSDKKMVVNKIDHNDDGGLNTTDKIEKDFNQNKLEVINTFFNYKYAQAKEIGGMCVTAMIEKTNAIKECLKLYRTIIRQSLTHNKKEPDGVSESIQIIQEFTSPIDEIKSRRLNNGFIDSTNEFKDQTDIFHNVKKFLDGHVSDIAKKEVDLKSKILVKKDYDLYKDIKDAVQTHITEFNKSAENNDTTYRTGILEFDNKLLMVVYNDKQNTISKIYIIFRKLNPTEGQSSVSFDEILQEKK
jgi:hypothetical protein